MAPNDNTNPRTQRTAAQEFLSQIWCHHICSAIAIQCYCSHQLYWFLEKTGSTKSANWVLPLLHRFVSAYPVLRLWKPPQKINNICIVSFHSYLGGLVHSLWHSKATLTSALQWFSFRKTSSLFSNKQKTESSSLFSNLDKQTNDKHRGYAATH